MFNEYDESNKRYLFHENCDFNLILILLNPIKLFIIKKQKARALRNACKKNK